VVIANPIPAAHEVPRERIEDLAAQAVAEARAQAITGKALTPFLLARLDALSGGESVDANVALAMNNARLAAHVAVAFAALAMR
jgi:pseudouridine-5'-phosphate glycosidase